MLRGQATPTGAFLSPRVDGSTGRTRQAAAVRPGAGARAAAEAGYPNGFAVTLDCVNVAYRENVCQAAAAMLTQVGIRTHAAQLARPTSSSRKLSQATASFVEFGWTPTPDPGPR